ncbi:MAG: hypothetical protein R3F11_07870 [Verrucomicrobiales bacterium]
MQPFLLWRNPAVLRDLRDAHARFKPGYRLLHNVIPVVSLGVYELLENSTFRSSNGFTTTAQFLWAGH